MTVQIFLNTPSPLTLSKLKKLKKKTRKKILKNQQKTNKNSKNKVGVIKLDTDSNSKS